MNTLHNNLPLTCHILSVTKQLDSLTSDFSQSCACHIYSITRRTRHNVPVCHFFPKTLPAESERKRVENRDYETRQRCVFETHTNSAHERERGTSNRQASAGGNGKLINKISPFVLISTRGIESWQIVHSSCHRRVKI